MKLKPITALIKNDLVLYVRNIFLFITSLVAFAIFITIYFLIPDTLEEQFVIGIYAKEVPELILSYFSKESTKIKQYDSDTKIFT